MALPSASCSLVTACLNTNLDEAGVHGGCGADHVDIGGGYMLSHIPLFVTPWTEAHQVPLSMEFSSQKYWNELPFPTLGIFQNQGLNPCLLHWQADSLPPCHLGSPKEAIDNK